MKTIRSNKYRRKRRRTDLGRLLMLLAIIGGAVVVAAAAAVVIVLLVVNKPANEPQQQTPVVSETISANDPSSEIAKINPNAATAKSSGKLAYQSLYPELYVPIVEKIPAKDGDKVVYLTFDNGPSALTPELLDILAQQKVKATFFVSCHGELTDTVKEQLKKIANGGHTIGIYAFTDNYNALYASVEDYLKDFSKMSDVIYEATGKKPTVFRFPGGSYCAMNQNIYKELIAEMERRGFTYFDWNVDSGDSLSNPSEKELYQATVDGITNHGKSIVLMHNSTGKDATVNQMEAIIKKVKKSGYRFDVLDPSVKPFSFAFPE